MSETCMYVRTCEVHGAGWVEETRRDNRQDEQLAGRDGFELKQASFPDEVDGFFFSFPNTQIRVMGCSVELDGNVPVVY